MPRTPLLPEFKCPLNPYFTVLKKNVVFILDVIKIWVKNEIIVKTWAYTLKISYIVKAAM